MNEISQVFLINLVPIADIVLMAIGATITFVILANLNSKYRIHIFLAGLSFLVSRVVSIIFTTTMTLYVDDRAAAMRSYIWVSWVSTILFYVSMGILFYTVSQMAIDANREISPNKITENSQPQNHDLVDKGGVMGFVKGTQSLTNAFWFLGVIPAVVLYVAGMMLVGTSHFLEKTVLVISIAAIVRLIAWFSIFRCLKNTESNAFKIAALIIVVVDIVHKMIFWPIFYFNVVPRLLG